LFRAIDLQNLLNRYPFANNLLQLEAQKMNSQELSGQQFPFYFTIFPYKSKFKEIQSLNEIEKQIDINFESLHNFVNRSLSQHLFLDQGYQISFDICEIRQPENGSLPLLDFWQSYINKSSILYLNRSNPLFCSKPYKFGLK
jgi:hypothetical protein